MKKVTVGELIDALSMFDRSDPVEVKIEQYNKIFPVAYCTPVFSNRSCDVLASKENGIDVRLAVRLPWDNKEYMTTSNRKIK